MPATVAPQTDRSTSGKNPIRMAVLPWMVAGVRTQYENLRTATVPADFIIDTIPIVPYKSDGLIERLPFLQPTQKGTLRSTTHVLPLLRRPSYDAIFTQVLLPLLPILAASSARMKRRPAIVYAIDTTPSLMDDFYQIYYNVSPAGTVKRTLRDLLFRSGLAGCAAIAPWSQWSARSFVEDYGVPEERVHVIPPGVDLDQWTAPADGARSATDPGSRLFRLLFVGADFERKGGPLLLDVFRRNLRERCELHLVTKVDMDEEPGVHVYRDFGPNDAGLRSLYHRSDALVLPTKADCFSLASLEAMACALPVISCPVGGIPEIVRDGETGFLIPPDDGRALLNSIEALVSDRSRARAMGRAGRSLVEARFDNRQNSLALFSLLREVALEARM